MKLSTLILCKELIEEKLKESEAEVRKRYKELAKLKDELDRLADDLPFPEVKDGYTSLKELTEKFESEYKMTLAAHTNLKLALQDFLTHEYN